MRTSISGTPSDSTGCCGQPACSMQAIRTRNSSGTRACAGAISLQTAGESPCSRSPRRTSTDFPCVFSLCCTRDQTLGHCAAVVCSGHSRRAHCRGVNSRRLGACGTNGSPPRTPDAPVTCKVEHYRWSQACHARLTRVWMPIPAPAEQRCEQHEHNTWHVVAASGELALTGINETDWTDAIDMPGAQAALAQSCPAWWPTSTRLLIHRVALSPTDQHRPVVEAAPDRAPGPACPVPRGARGGRHRLCLLVYPDHPLRSIPRTSQPRPSTGTGTAPRSRTFRDAKHGAAWPHLPSGYAQVNTAWIRGALITTSLAGYLHQLTATPNPGGELLGWALWEGKAMITSLRHRLICVSRPPDPPRRSTYPAPATGPPAAHRGPHPTARPLRSVLTRPIRPQPTPEPAHPRRPWGLPLAHTLKTTTRRSQTRNEDHFMLLLAELSFPP